MDAQYFRAGVLTILLLALLMGVAAGDPPTISVTKDKEWLVANGTDTGIVSVSVYNGTIPMNGTRVTFAVDNPVYGSFNVSSATTSNGCAAGRFTTAYKSGTAQLLVNVTYRLNEASPEVTEYFQLAQKIDHDVPYKISAYKLKSEGTVATSIPITVWVQDAHDNPIDNRRELEESRLSERVNFTLTGGPEPLGSFYPEGTVNVTRYVNSTGAVDANLTLSIHPGVHNVKAEPEGIPVPKKWTIDGVADGEPWYIVSQVFPESLYQPADGEAMFDIIYTIMDQYGNGLQAKDFNIITTIGENFTLGTNASGMQAIRYGPSTEVGLIEITATTLQNLSVSVTDQVEFVNTSPFNMVFTATPQSMPSADARPTQLATLTALVVDIEGNAIAGEWVRFYILPGSIVYEPTGTVLIDPSLQNGTVSGVTEVWAESDVNGIAYAWLKPCTFISNKSAPGYNASATGHVTVVAEWTNATNVTLPRTQDFTFKNFPYLSAQTIVSASKVAVNDTVDVTLWLRGDGFALLPKPIDAILVCDRSGSMGERDMENLAGTPNSWTRWRAEQEAANVFIRQMNSSTDRLGLVRYNNANNNNVLTPVYAPGSVAFTTISNAINTTSASGYTGTRKALQRAIELMIQTPNPDPAAIRAIVLMTDGEFNYFGDPLARGTGYDSTHTDGSTYYAWSSTTTSKYTYFSGLGGTRTPSGASRYTNQNMTLYAKNNSIVIYTISLSNDISEGSVTWETMDNLAEVTGGKHFHAVSTQELSDVYEQIAGELKNKAGVGTTSDLDFENVEVKNATVPGADVFEYVYVPDASTYTRKWNATTDNYSMRNDTLNWTTNHALSFDIGTMYVNDNWLTTFRLKVLTDGDIHVFGADSIIEFNGGTDWLMVPDTVITAVPNMTTPNTTYGEFTETNITVTHLHDYTYQFNWERHYTGSQTVREYYFISIDGGQQWILIGEQFLSPDQARNTPVGQLIRDLYPYIPYYIPPEGLDIRFEIKSFAEDAPSPRIPRSDPILMNALTDKHYIVLS